MRVGDIECLIEVKGEMALNEYGVQRSADGRTCMAWIPSRIDQVRILAFGMTVA